MKEEEESVVACRWDSVADKHHRYYHSRTAAVVVVVVASPYSSSPDPSSSGPIHLEYSSDISSPSPPIP